MISFSAANQLKQESFPYRISISFYDNNGNVKLLSKVKSRGRNFADLERVFVPIPTVDDLLWALGLDLRVIVQVAESHWEAYDRDERPVKGMGGTIEDALAMLWIGRRQKQRV